MTRLSVHLFGHFYAELDDRPVRGFKTEKDRILLAYLLVEKAYPKRRESLSELLWPERPQGAALANLRHTLSILRQGLQDHQEDPPFLIIRRRSLQINPAADIWTDVEQFEQLLQDRQSPAQTADRLEKAVCCYSCDFLEGTSGQFSRELSLWIYAQRARLYQELILALGQLTRFYGAKREFGKALQFGYRKVGLEPCDESANNLLITLLAQDGQRSAALAHYETYRLILMEEMGAVPSRTTARLIELVRTGMIRGIFQETWLKKENLFYKILDRQKKL
jgi:DNA-binding SARP family transcriptional activator